VELHASAQRIIGLALAACEKTVQLVYEHQLRPIEKRHQAWIDRVRGQLSAAYALLEAELASSEAWLFGARPLQADISTAVAWRFTQSVLPADLLPPHQPYLSAFSRRAEQLTEFLFCPIDEWAPARIDGFVSTDG